jgi:hypothetical protein
VLDKWACECGVEHDFSRPGKTTDNAAVESFNGRLRQECLKAHGFLSWADAQAKIGTWRQGYNENRPHSAHTCRFRPLLLAAGRNSDVGGAGIFYFRAVLIRGQGHLAPLQ